MRRVRRLSLCLVWVVAVALGLAGAAAAFTRTYTTDDDFAEGEVVGLVIGGDQLQLDPGPGPQVLPFIWIPNEEGTVSKINTETGYEVARYRVSDPDWPPPSASRTTVDLYGNCWVGCRQRGTVVKIGLFEAGQWIDRNADGLCQTSWDVDGDGDITASEILGWGEDECVLWEVVLVPGHEGPYAPGTYPGPYDYDFWGVAPRGLAVDASNNLWAGTWSTSTYYYIDGAAGTILQAVDVSSLGHNAYGAALDANGVLWSSNAGNHMLWLDPSADPPTMGTVSVPGVYGVGLDYLGHLFAAGWSYLTRIDVDTKAVDWARHKPELDLARGVVCTADSDIWVASSNGDAVFRYDNDGDLKAAVPVGSHPTGVAVDMAGKVWTCDLYDEYVHRIDPATNAVDLSKAVVNSGGHYTYSDMTGVVSTEVGARSGTWRVVCDSEIPDFSWWATLWWNGEPQGYVPPGASIVVSVRSSDDGATWSPWQVATDGVQLPTALRGRYLQVEARLRSSLQGESPFLSDLTIIDYGGRVLDVGDGQASPGEVGTVPVVLTDASDVAGLQFDVTYCLGRPGLLGFVEAQKGPGLPEDWAFDYNPLPDNRARIVAYSPAATPLPSGPLVIAEINFTADWGASPGEHCALHPHDIILSDPMGFEIQPVAGADGTFTVIPPVDHFCAWVIPGPPEPQGGDLICPLPFTLRVEAHDENHWVVGSYNGQADLTACCGIDPASITFSSGVWEGPAALLCDLDPDCVITVQDASDPPLPVWGSTEVFTVRGKGDPTGDGEVNVLDVIRTVRIALELSIPEPPRYEFQWWAGDMDCDEMVNVLDVIQVVNKSLGRTAGVSALATSAAAGPVAVRLVEEDHGTWSVQVSNVIGVAGVQVEIAGGQGEVLAGELASVAGWQVESNRLRGRLRALGYSPSARGLQIGEGELVRLTGVRGRLRLEKVVLSDALGRPVAAQSDRRGR